MHDYQKGTPNDGIDVAVPAYLLDAEGHIRVLGRLHHTTPAGSGFQVCALVNPISGRPQVGEELRLVIQLPFASEPGTFPCVVSKARRKEADDLEDLELAFADLDATSRGWLARMLEQV